MRIRNRLKMFIPAMVLIACQVISAQKVPLGIHYQAVARDNYGKELSNVQIDVRFTIRSGNPLGDEVYQELHQKVRTSYYGVFSLVIGQGIVTKSTGSSIADVNWEEANHYIQVEVKFDNDFIDMGTMQFLAVPYALYAFKSLEPGPQGPQGIQGPQGAQGLQGLKGEPGNPATDDQVLSFDGINLSISGGNTVNVSSLNKPHNLALLGDTLSILGGNGVSLKDYRQNLSFNSGSNLLSISGGAAVDLTPVKQNLNLTGNTLTITNIANPTPIDLSKYHQTLSFNSGDNTLSILNGNSISLTALKDDADANPTNEIQALSFEKTTGNLTISPGNTTVNMSNVIGFKARKTTNQTGLNMGTTYPFVVSEEEFDEGSRYDTGSGTFTAPNTGIYTFFITYKADGTGSSRVLSILKNGNVYEVLGPDISAGTELSKWVTLKLNQGDYVSLTINTGMSTFSGTGSFVGYLAN